jgi:death-on-curing protein
VAEAVWVERLVLDAVHLDQLREHGGLMGVRDENALESALARARQKWHYQPTSDLAALAAAYGFGLVTSHAYRDGNKRIGFLAMAIFLGLNGFEIEAPEAEVVTLMLALADHRCTETELADWVRAHLVPLA